MALFVDVLARESFAAGPDLRRWATRGVFDDRKFDREPVAVPSKPPLNIVALLGRVPGYDVLHVLATMIMSWFCRILARRRGGPDITYLP